MYHDISRENNTPEDFREVYCASTPEVAQRFNERIRNLEGKQIVLVSHPWTISDSLNVDRSWERLIMTPNVANEMGHMEKAFSAEVENNVFFFLPDEFRAPFPLSGYDHIHVVVGSKPFKKGFGFAVGQATTFKRLLSIQERLELRSHFLRLGSRPSFATFYVGGEKKPDAAFEWRHSRPMMRRQAVWNHSLGAFTAIVASFGPKVDAATVVQCFVPEGLFTVYLTMAYRLQTHGILKWNTDERLVMGLEGRELAVFLTVLPFVEYDYRLAYIVAANMALCLKADQTWTDISSALATCGVETVRKGFAEESELSADECNEIQKHLFKAYVSQLCSCVKQNDTIELLDISSKRTINGFLRWSEYAISFDNLPEGKPAFGVYHSLVRDTTEVNFRDWTMIPGRIVAIWVNEFRDRVGQPGLEIESMLRTDGSPRQNYDSIKGEAWEAPDW
ncbi:hypothetical protein FOYG_00236 [Fusarium oxysporum NRRL 32931]|uniref:Uncharacterized protein n=1 Tax=Fusarium oxysporum NRRL 32931 TaxID=660029 RepID=W9IZE2_FUSOX|nr:hypothetical protein FOYG_00236 [Fusarium oxysporum NRRL 32931]